MWSDDSKCPMFILSTHFSRQWVNSFHTGHTFYSWRYKLHVLSSTKTVRLYRGTCLCSANGQSVGKLWRAVFSVTDIHPTSSAGILQRDLAHFRKQLPPGNLPPSCAELKFWSSWWSVMRHDHDWRFKMCHVVRNWKYYMLKQFGET